VRVTLNFRLLVSGAKAQARRVVVRRPSFFLLPLIYLGFISLGLPDGTLGIAWPAIYPELHVPIGMAGTITLVATLLSALAGFNSGRIIARFHTGPVVLVSCVLTGAGLVALAHASNLGWLLATAVPLGLGAGAVDAGLNGFVARHYSGRHMNWLHACWGLGATSGPVLMGQALASSHGWRGGYLLIGSIQLALALLFLLTLRLWDVVPERPAAAATAGPTRLRAAPPADSFAGWLSPAIFVLYVSVEMTTGVWVGSILVVGRGFEPATAALCVAAFYGAITGGRILVGFVVDRHGNRRLVTLGTLVALAGAGMFAAGGSVPLVFAALVLMGLGFAPVYPCLMHEVPHRFAPEAAQTVIGRQSGAGGIGASALPAAAGLLAQESINGIPWLVLLGLVALIAAIRLLDRLT
jgi:MFS family permease